MQDDLAGLIERCRELVAWSKKGVLVGDAIRTLASEKFGDPIYDHDRICQAEKLTTKEALAFIANNLETFTRELDEARAEIEQLKLTSAAVVQQSQIVARADERTRTQLTATQARLEEAVGLLADALTGTRDWQRRRFSFLAQQEGQSNG